MSLQFHCGSIHCGSIHCGSIPSEHCKQPGCEFISSIKAIWLWCAIDENHRRDQMRVPENQMKERVDIVNEELRTYVWPEYVQRVDTTKLSVDETIKAIENLH